MQAKNSIEGWCAPSSLALELQITVITGGRALVIV